MAEQLDCLYCEATFESHVERARHLRDEHPTEEWDGPIFHDKTVTSHEQ